MPLRTTNKDKDKGRETPDSSRSGSIPPTATANRQSTRRNGPPLLDENQQDIKDSLGGRKYLEKHSLLSPPGEPPSHLSLSTCLHQISALSGLQKPAINAIRSVAFLLNEMEDTQINETVREALDIQMTELTTDMKTLVEDAKEKINDLIKSSEERLTNLTATLPTTQAPTQPSQPTNTYAAALINPPAYANPRVAAREGIKARQFLIEGIKNSKFSHLDSLHLKAEFNKLLIEAGLTTGKIRSTNSTRGGGTIIETDNDEAATWLSNTVNQRKICDLIGSNAEFRVRAYNVIAFNVPIAINPNEFNHRLEICEANDLEATIITSAKWAKATDRRSPTQKSAHLLLTFSNADAANRAIVNGLSICNRRCRVERTKREPIRCLKCQGWNHYAKDCAVEKDSCGNCAGPHRTASCLTSETGCVSCQTKDHASWSRSCPTYIRKRDEFNARNPENSLQFFPTADPWSWTPNDRSAAPQAPASQPRRQNDTYVPNRKNDVYIPSKRTDTYIPSKQTDTYRPTYRSQPTLAGAFAQAGWGDDTNPNGQRQPNQSSQPNPSTQQTATNSNSNPNPIPNPGLVINTNRSATPHPN